MYEGRVIQTMIASPSDVTRERQLARDVIHEWNAVNAQAQATVVLPVGWDTHASPLMGARAQEVINSQILAHCDLLVAVFWTRLGSPTGEAASGTVEEIERHVELGRPAMLYFSNAPVRLDSVDAKQYEALQAFRRACEDRGLLETFDDVGEFEAKFRRQLSQTIIRQFLSGNATATAPIPVPTVSVSTNPQDVVFAEEAQVLSETASKLLLAAADDPHGTIMRVRVFGGTIIQTNGEVLNERGNARSEAMWASALEELESEGLIEVRGLREEIYSVTHAGYQCADLLRT